MKKTVIILSAAVLALVACNKSMDVNTPDAPIANEMSFKVMSAGATKAGELTGISLPKAYGIYTAATQKNAAGLIENPSFFVSPFEQLFGTAEDDPSGINTASAAADTRLWHAGEFWDDDSDPETPDVYRNTPIYWPIGGVKMDFLGYSLPVADHNTPLALGATANTGNDWAVLWDNQLTDVASQFTFYDVDTYANQVDLMYAYANNQTNSANGGSGKSVAMAFDHAQALLIFNVKVNEAASGKLQIDEIAFYTDARVGAMRADQVAVAGGASPALAALADADVTLKTFGTFRVDNRRNDLIAEWSFGKDIAGATVSPTKKENYKMPNGGAHGVWAADKEAAYAAIDADDVNYPTSSDKDTAKAAWDTANPEPAADVVSASNTTVQGQTSKTVQAYAAAIPFITGDEYAQLGESLLIPEQEKVNFTITYTIGGKKFFYTYNDLRGVWEKGKKYIYNLNLTINEIVITESVSNFDGTPEVVAIN